LDGKSRARCQETRAFDTAFGPIVVFEFIQNNVGSRLEYRLDCGITCSL